MSILALRPTDQCRWDLVSLGEVMLRFDPGEGRIATARSFRVWEGGGEYNVARALRRCFGLRSAIVTALADNPIGRLVEDLMLQGGVEQAQLEWRPYDGVGRSLRNGLNFVERGYGIRAAVGVSDRGHTAVSQLEPGVVNWERIFGRHGARWFHTGGIFCALSPSAIEVALEAVAEARRHGTVVSYDLNYRPSLWQATGGSGTATEVNRRIATHVDVLLGNEEDYSAALGFELGSEDDWRNLDTAAYGELLAAVLEAFPNVKVAAVTLREAHTATRNSWTAVLRTRDGCHTGPVFPDLEVLDRVGGGDGFTSGLAYGLLSDLDAEQALAYGVAHGALAMTTPGDTSMATLAEVEGVLRGDAARIER